MNNTVSWRHCFRDFLLMPIETTAEGEASQHDLKRNRVFRHVLSRLYGALPANYDSFFFMTGHSFPTDNYDVFQEGNSVDLSSAASFRCKDAEGQELDKTSIEFKEPRLSFHSMSCEKVHTGPTPPIAPTHRWHTQKLNMFLMQLEKEPQRFAEKEMDAVPVLEGWLERFLLETMQGSSFAIRGSSDRGDDALPGKPHRYINGNAIYNLRHPWLRFLYAQLEQEAFTVFEKIPFDVRMAHLTLEAQRGLQDEHAKAYVSLVALDEEPYQDDSQLIGSFGNTLLNHSFEPGVFIRQASLSNIFYNLEETTCFNV
eukprot:symbB.v1.2.025379.t1/scaffold2459.1/size78741/3